MQLYVVMHNKMNHPMLSDVGFFQDRLKKNYFSHLLSEKTVHAFNTEREAMLYASSLFLNSVDVPVYRVRVDDIVQLNWTEIECYPQHRRIDHDGDHISKGQLTRVRNALIPRASMQFLEKVKYPVVTQQVHSLAQRNDVAFTEEEGALDSTSGICVIQ